MTVNRMFITKYMFGELRLAYTKIRLSHIDHELDEEQRLEKIIEAENILDAIINTLSENSKHDSQ